MYPYLNVGLIPKPGSIRGRVFEDTVPNGVFDAGEPAFGNVVVFLDTDGDGILDANERSVRTDSTGSNKGAYEFTNVDSYRAIEIALSKPIGFDVVSPGSNDKFSWNVFLPPGGNFTDLDFALREVTPTGQSSDSKVRGRVLSDSNGNGFIDAADTPVSGMTIFFDGGRLGTRDLDDSAEVTDANGFYEFNSLPTTLTPVRLLLDEANVQLSPVGNDLLGNNSLPFRFPLGDTEKRNGNPQSVVTGQFNSSDTFPDVAVLLAETNTLSIRLNDRLGGFTSQKFDFNLSNFAIELVLAMDFLIPTRWLQGNSMAI